jgi:hypothetical protein
VLLDFLTDKLIDDHIHNPLIVLGADGVKGFVQPQELAALRNEIPDNVAESQKFLDLYREVLLTPTLENVTDLFTNSGYDQEAKQYWMRSAIMFLAVHDAGSRDINGCTTTEAFLGNQEIVHTAFMHRRRGIGVTAIAKEKGIARSTAYDQLGRFAAWPAQAQETMLDCMQLFGGEKFDPEAAPVALNAH